ncbi:hypothetical protein [Kineosporia sp. NBRC 101731]|uniref:hypothetical protein n=1 Tax=Kineosporia sp. NBRC 101731 TaxID=3032199 RepID=UPI0024A3A503|nr:hypothetical protein [Kineosporia sp. NBRC 101731]GLY26766.1 hypothetical protein Kisp02_01310 [Kineosporia sp. NBRC 101731]
MIAPRAVLVHRRSELDLLLERHSTRGQAEFFLRSRGRDLQPVQDRHDALHEALRQVEAGIPGGWRRASVERADLPRLRFDPEDVVVAVGQDGLVANVAKYLSGQPVIGVDPEPGLNPGVLVRHSASASGDLLGRVTAGKASVEQRTMVEAVLDDGQRLRALNELYLGDAGHQSARYRLRGERQSSSGILVGTGTGSTGWCASLARDRAAAPELPGPLDESLAWFVREAWPSPFTGTTQTQGSLARGEVLPVVAEADLVVFGDGLESDRLQVGWGQQIEVRTASQHLSVVV